jgi:hypothetical protein
MLVTVVEVATGKFLFCMDERSSKAQDALSDATKEIVYSKRQNENQKWDTVNDIWIDDQVLIDNSKKKTINIYCNNEIGTTQECCNHCSEEEEMVRKSIITEGQRVFTSTQANEMFTYRKDIRAFSENPNDLDNPTYPLRPAWFQG